MSNATIEFNRKLESMRRLLEEHGCDALLLSRVSSFAWATCGAASHVNLATGSGEAKLLITKDRHHLITDNIEAPRLIEEERLELQGWTFHVKPWYELGDEVNSLVEKGRIGADIASPGVQDLSIVLSHLRSLLSPEEQERFKELGQDCGKIISNVVEELKPGLEENHIAAAISYEAQRRDIQAIVNLVAADERIFYFRHPLPTKKKLQKYAMLVLCGRRHGLVCSITRLIHLGKVPEELFNKAKAVAEIDARYIHLTRPGATLGDIMSEAVRMYEAVGYPEEWKKHHQGGIAGYEPRERIATPGSREVICVSQAFAWNPSITGVKSEDTILVDEGGNRILTSTEGWPMQEISIEGCSYERPAILEI